MGNAKFRLFGSIIGFLQHVSLNVAFNVDTDSPKIFRESASEFGYQVCHFGSADSDSLLVTAPVRDNSTGVVYRCSYSNGSCSGLRAGDSGIAFGLSLACDGNKAMVCGPRLTHDCDSFSFLNGQCVELGPGFTVQEVHKPAFQECRESGLDAVILFDDSQSIGRQDFATMISFIKSVVRMFADPRSQVAVAQYSTFSHAVFHFENFVVNRDPDVLLSQVQQYQGQTYTPSAIRFVLTNMLVKERGMRANSRKLLVVITDGRSNDPRDTFDVVIPLAEEMGVVRYAIGVGKVYSIEELRQIASSPSNVFETDSFSALNSIQEQLKEKLFAIEGTSKSNSTAFQLELSQGGFSTLLAQETKLFGAVGAYEWSGGIVAKSGGANSSFINASTQEPGIMDSYLGYSVAVAQVNGTAVYFAGAPRFQHMGLVLGFQQQMGHPSWAITHRIYGTQLGSYFGAVLCVLGVSSSVLLVGAPHFHGPGFGGEVRVCVLEPASADCSSFLRGSAGNEMGQFGASLSSVPDLSGDGIPEVAVGAPLEDEGRGALYIFLGRLGGLHTKHSQRILGKSVDQRLRYFGLSLHSNGDLNSDGLSDLVVGSRGAAVVLRSQPVTCVSTSVTLHPPVIPQDFFHCATYHSFSSHLTTAMVCVAVHKVHTGNVQGPFGMEVSVSLDLDRQRSPPRLLLSTSSWKGVVSERVCFNVSISIPECISDYRAVPLSGYLSVRGQKIEGTRELKSVMSPSCPSSFSHPVLLEQVCGEDQMCISDLQVTLNVTSLVVVRAPGFLVDLMVRVSNQGEDAQSTVLKLVYPSSLSFSQATKGLGKTSLRCTSNSKAPRNYTQTVCQLGPFALRKMTSMEVRVLLLVSDPSFVEDNMTASVSVSSANENNGTLQDNSVSCAVSTRLPLSMLVKEGDSTHYLSFPKNHMLEHTYTVQNIGETAVPLNVSFILPVNLGLGFWWNVSRREAGHAEASCTTANVSATFRKFCNGTLCQLIGCTLTQLKPSQPVIFTFEGNVTSDSKVSEVHTLVVSWAFLSFDQKRYIQFPAGAAHNRSITTVLETTPVANTTAMILGSLLGSLLLLIIAAAVFYKAGFFKSRFDNEQKEPEGATSPPDDTETVL